MKMKITEKENFIHEIRVGLSHGEFILTFTGKAGSRRV